MFRYSVDSVPIPCIKCCINISFGIDNSGYDKNKLIVSGPGCSQTLSFLLGKIKNLIAKINNLGQQEEGKTELIF
jgi:hypothetical protein